jgi:Ca2+/Na+ antiporter
MNKILIPLMVVCFFIAFYEQNEEKPNQIITALAVVVFVFGMIKLSAKTPSKNQDNDNE